MKSDFLAKSGVANICVDPFYKILFVSINGGISAGYKIDEEKWVSDYNITFDGAINDGDRCLFFAICENETSYVLLGDTSGSQSSNIEFRTLTSSIVGSIRNLGMRTGIQDRKSVYKFNIYK